jgi:hypothetical protein
MVAIALLGCGVSEDQCDQDLDLCIEQCFEDGDPEACFDECEEVHAECLDGADQPDDDAETAATFLELLALLFGGDDEDEC